MRCCQAHYLEQLLNFIRSCAALHSGQSSRVGAGFYKHHIIVAMKKWKVLLLFVTGFTSTISAQTGDNPPNAQPGKCYAKCYMPDIFETTTEQVAIKAAMIKAIAVPAVVETKNAYQLVKEESRRFLVTPAKFTSTTLKVDLPLAAQRFGNTAAESTTEYVLVKEESKRYVVTPAVYETVSESYVVEPATIRIEYMPPAYETVTDRIETKPAVMKWTRKTTDANCLNANPDDCMIWCMVEVPAEYQTLTRRVNKGCDGSGKPDAGCNKTVEVPAVMGSRSVQRLKRPASIREEIVPAEYKAVTVRRTDPLSTTVTRQIQQTPASYREEIIPAEYKATPTKVVVTPATTRSETTPPEYVTVTKRKLVRAGGFSEWKEVLCGEKVTGYTVRQIQDALRKAGYYKGISDNTMGASTKAALIKFQQDKGLPVGNVDLETLRALGVNY